MLGKKQSEYQKQRAREANLGNQNGVGKRSKDFRQKIKKIASNRDMKLRLGMKNSKESNLKRSQSLKGWTTRKTIKEVEEWRLKIKEARSKQVLPLEDTIPEKLFQKALEDKNIKFETHKKLPGLPDIFIKPNICIFIDGDYWHANPKIYLNSDKKIQFGNKVLSVEEIWEKDKKITNILQKKGYKVLRFWEYDIKRNISDCIKGL